MADRYFITETIAGDSAMLRDAEAHHLLHVMRAKPGAEVTLFDGSGMEYLARVERTTRSTVELAILSKASVDRELPFPLVAAVALPKGDRQKWLVEKLTELGVSKLVPLETARGVAQPAEGTLDRLRRSVIEASKQCGRNRLMEISEAQSCQQFFNAGETDQIRWLAHPGGELLATVCDRARTQLSQPSAIVLVIGPEGGFTEAEAIAANANGWQVVDLGARILRIETAAIFLAGAAGLLAARR